MSEIREIIGNTTATSLPRPDWEQTDETKADYIKNKPIFAEIELITIEDIDAICRVTIPETNENDN